jgi:DNA-binding GntR family transcriptional regulator
MHLPSKVSRSGVLYNLLREAILSGELGPGERLVEDAIAREAKVSRTPVREALHRLESDGLVQPSSQGMVVTAHSEDELYDLCVARLGIEGLVARLAAGARTELDVANFEHIIEETRVATDLADVPRLVELNHAFHEAVWRAGRNRYLASELRLLRGLIERLQPTTLSVRSRQLQAYREHVDLADAVGHGDAASAESIARGHFETAMAIRLSGKVHGLAVGGDNHDREAST